MVLLSVLALGILSLGTVTLRSSGVGQARAEARANAKMALMIAISQLQKHAGPDQRITTNGSFGGSGTTGSFDSNPVSVENPWITGVWKRSNLANADGFKVLDPNHPDYVSHPINFAEARWLVSGNEVTQETTPSTVIPDPGTVSPPTSVWMLRKSLVDAGLSSADVDELSVKVPLVETDSGAYGYWVSDESQKAAADLHRPDVADFARSPALTANDLAKTGIVPAANNIAEMADLDIMPSADKDPTATGKTTWEKLITLNSLEVASDVTGGSAAIRTALAQNVHNLTTSSNLVLADAKVGGLKRDLSLGFEMSDANFNASKFFTRAGQNAPAASATAGNLIANNSFKNEYRDGPALITPAYTYEMIHYRDDDETPVFFDSPTDSTGAIKALGNSIKMSPWHALRSYHQAYKKVAAGPQLTATPMGVHSTIATDIQSSANGMFHSARAPETDGVMTRFTTSATRGAQSPIVNPTSAGFVPIAARVRYQFSLKATADTDTSLPPRDTKLELIMTPTITLWNPYNIQLNVEGYRLRSELPDLLFVIEKEEAHVPTRIYSAGEQVVHNGETWEANANGTVSPTPSAPAWTLRASQNGRILAATNGLQKMSSLQYGGNDFILLEIDSGNPFVLEPGELRVFSAAGSAPIPAAAGAGVMASLDLQKGYREEGGISYDRLSTSTTTPKVIVDGAATIYFTMEPRRLNYQANDPFKFIQRYGVAGPNGLARFRSSPTDAQVLAGLPGDWDLNFGTADGWILEEQLKVAAAGYAIIRSGAAVNLTGEDLYGKKTVTGGETPLPGTLVPAPTASSLRAGGAIPPIIGYFDWYLKDESEADPTVNIGGSVNPNTPVVIGKFNPRMIYNFHTIRGPYKRSAVLPYGIKIQDSNGQTLASNNDKGYWGQSNTAVGTQNVSLFEVPTAPLVSIGQLQHFQASLIDTEPAYSVGNSITSPEVPLNKASIFFAEGGNNTNRGSMSRIDRPWYMNEVLFDNFYFSSLLPTTDEITAVVVDGKPLRNPRYAFINPNNESDATIQARLEAGNTDGFQQSAANLFVRGGFNVNSTSKEAWKAFLAGAKGAPVLLKVPGAPLSLNSNTGVAFPRGMIANEGDNVQWQGYRELDDAELDELAEKIVDQVRLRGPFHSISDFVNRRLVGTALAPDPKGEAGAIAAAIAAADLNSTYTKTYDAARAATATTDTGLPATNSFTFPANSYGKVAQGASPHFLQQGDILQAIAPMLTVRGDTFSIRAYGEARNSSNEVIAKSWCEATVQRTPLYVDSTLDPVDPAGNTPWVVPDLVSNGNISDRLTATNRRLGRKFEIVTFRWLNENEV